MKTIQELQQARENEISLHDIGGLPAHTTNDDYKFQLQVGNFPYSFPVSGDATSRRA